MSEEPTFGADKSTAKAAGAAEHRPLEKKSPDKEGGGALLAAMSKYTPRQIYWISLLVVFIVAFVVEIASSAMDGGMYEDPSDEFAIVMALTVTAVFIFKFVTHEAGKKKFLLVLFLFVLYLFQSYAESRENILDYIEYEVTAMDMLSSSIFGLFLSFGFLPDKSTLNEKINQKTSGYKWAFISIVMFMIVVIQAFVYDIWLAGAFILSTVLSFILLHKRIKQVGFPDFGMALFLMSNLWTINWDVGYIISSIVDSDLVIVVVAAALSIPLIIPILLLLPVSEGDSQTVGEEQSTKATSNEHG